MHTSVSLVHPKSKEIVEIDEELSKLISLLWDKGFNTLQSCQEVLRESPWGRVLGPGYAWIQFATIEDVKRFCCTVQSHVKLHVAGKHVHFRRQYINEIHFLIERSSMILS